MDIFLLILVVLVLLFFFSPIILLLQVVWGLTKLAFHTIRLLLTGAIKTLIFISKKVESKAPPPSPAPDSSQEQN